MHIRYLLRDNGIEFEEEMVTGQTWAEWKPKTVCIRERERERERETPKGIDIKRFLLFFAELFTFLTFLFSQSF